jgi:hypothetical protein
VSDKPGCERASEEALTAGTYGAVALAKDHDKVVLDGLVDLVLVVGHFASVGTERSSLCSGE